MPWYIVKTLPRCETTAQWFLANRPVQVFLAYVSRRIVHRRKLITKLEPMFPNYLFVESPVPLSEAPQLCHDIDYSPGVSHILRGASREPAPLADGVIDAIRERMVNNAVPIRGPFDPEPKDAIRVIGGKYQGLSGILECPIGDGRVAAMLCLFNRLNRVVLDESDVILAL